MQLSVVAWVLSTPASVHGKPFLNTRVRHLDPLEALEPYAAKFDAYSISSPVVSFTAIRPTGSTGSPGPPAGLPGSPGPLAYLQPQTAKEWRSLCEDLVWPSVFSGGWTEAVCLYDLGNAIADLTADDTIYVKNLDTPLWARFLQILEDVGPAWVVAVLYYIFACCAEYHHARGPEEPPNSQLPKGRCTFQWWTRRAGARGSQMFQAWGVWSLCPGLP